MGNEKVKPSAFIIQGLATLSIAYLTSLTGFFGAWPSYTIENFASNETVLSWPMSTVEISIFGSLNNMGSLIMTPFCGYLVDKLGRKKSAMLFGLPFVLAWTIISLTTYVPLVIAAMGIAGFGAAGQTVSSVYIAEISQDSIRGGLSSSTAAGLFIGLLMSYAFGGHLTYYQVLYTHLTLSVLYVVMLTIWKESPVFLIRQGKDQEAAQSISFYRRVSVTSKEVEMEIKKIKMQLDPKNNILQEKNHRSVMNEEFDAEEPFITAETYTDKKNQSSLRFLKQSSTSKRALSTVLILMSVSIMMGAIILQVYAQPLFAAAVPSMPSNTCAIFLAADFAVATVVCASIVDWIGRKKLTIFTSVGTGCISLLIAAQLHWHLAPDWVTATLIYVYCFTYNLGAATVPFILTAELFLPEVRGLCSSITMAFMWFFNWFTLIIYNPIVHNLGLIPLFLGFSFFSFVMAFYSTWNLPETKGLAADAIQLLFLKRKKSVDKS